jgi:hypothetical protein
LVLAVEKQSRENIPEEERGEGTFARKCTPGSWREDLTPEQAETVERLRGPYWTSSTPAGGTRRTSPEALCRSWD